jgi:hypothetical protein
MDIEPTPFTLRARPAFAAIPRTRAIVTVERVPSRGRASVAGPELVSAFEAIDGISAARIVHQFLDRTTVRFESADGSGPLERVDRMLDQLGMRRIR